MEPLLNPTLSDLPRARRRRADRTLTQTARDLPGRPAGGGDVDERVNLAIDGGYTDSPGDPGRGPVYDLGAYRTADQRAVEAMLASVREPCTAQQLAQGLGWPLTRTVAALQQLEAALANTGQILTRLGHHKYMLGRDRGSFTAGRSPAAAERRPDHAFLSSPFAALNIVIAADVWKNTSLVAFFLLAGLTTIPSDLYEAARVDGYSRWGAFVHITLPLLRPVIVVVLVLRTIEAFKVFRHHLRDDGWGTGQRHPEHRLLHLSAGLLERVLGYGSALAYLIVLFILGLAVLYIRMLRADWNQA